MYGIAKKVFEYDNFRLFLKDFFDEQRKVRASLSKRYFARKAGFASHSQISHLIAGRRNITEKTMAQFLDILGLDGKSAEYFMNLVRYNQARSIEQKQQYLKNLNIIRLKVRYFNLSKSQYKYFDKWYYPVIRELAVMMKWDEDYKKLAQCVEPSITADEAKEAVRTLLELHMLKKDEQGNYYQLDNVLFPGEVPSFAYKKARRDMIMLSLDAAENLPPEKRFFYNCTLSLNDNSFERLMELIKSFEKDFETVFVTEDSNSNKVYQFNLQFFPVSKDLAKENQPGTVESSVAFTELKGISDTTLSATRENPVYEVQ